MIVNLQKKSLALAVALAGSAMAPAVLAAEEGSSLALEEVVVTAQKREQSLQDAPLAITAFDATAIEKQGIDTVGDIGLYTPNVQVTQSPGGATGATVAIRGSTTINPAITWEPTVGLYLDGVFLGKNIGGVFDIAQLERVEVLRGPQGTLYGKNTVGGAINLVTRKPAEEFGAEIRGTAGNYGLWEGFLSVDTGKLGPVSANLSYLTAERDGFYDNEYSDPFSGFNPLVNSVSSDEFNNLDNEVYRVDVLLEPGENFEARYVFDYSDRDNLPAKGQLTDVNQAMFNSIGQGALGGALAAYDTDDGNNADSISNDFSQFERSQTGGHALTLSLDAGSWGALGDVTLKSISSLRSLEFEDAIDIDGSNMDLFHSGRDIDYDQASQEFQMVGKTDRNDYVIGLYYFQEEADVLNPISFFGFNGVGSPTDNNEYGMDNSSLAAFGQTDWRPPAAALQDRLTLTAGVRWTEEEKEQYIFHPNTSGTGATIPRTTVDDTWDNISGNFTATWEVSENANVYGRIAQGWKSGGFNGEAPNLAEFESSYDAEEVLSYELGLKSRLMEDRIQLNVAVFQNNIDNMQFSVFLEGSGGAASTVDNAGEATISGAELEVTMQLSESVRVNANYGYLDAQYDEFIELGVDVKNGKDFPYAPEYSYSVGIDWMLAQASWGNVDLHLDWSFKDDYVPYTNPEQNATSSIDGYGVVNARLSLADVALGGSSTLEFALWGKNLADEQYRLNTIPFGFWTTSYYGDPRTYGLDAILRF